MQYPLHEDAWEIASANGREMPAWQISSPEHLKHILNSF